MDVGQNTRALDQGKAMLHAAIVAEVHHALGPTLLGLEGPVRLRFTEAMAVPLVALYRYGREEAVRVMDRMGLSPTHTEVAYVEADPAALPAAVRPVALRLRADLDALELTVEADVSAAREYGPLHQVPAIAMQRLTQVPGALDAASYLTVPPYNAGQADVYRANAGLFGGYVYSAAGDSRTCDPCQSKDGTEYRTLDEAATDGMDGFGPNPFCLGGPRCRCTLVPMLPEDAARSGLLPPIGGVDAPAVPSAAAVSPVAAQAAAGAAAGGGRDS